MKTIEPGSPLPIGAPQPPRANIAAMAAVLNQQEEPVKPGPKEQGLRALRESTATLADKIAAAGVPDACNRHKTMTPEQIAEANARVSRITARSAERKIKNPPNTSKPTTLMALATTPEAKALAKEITAKKDAATKKRLDALKASKPKPKPPVQPKADTPPAPADQQESAMRKTNKTTKSKARAAVKPKTATKAATGGKSKVEIIAGLLTRKEGCTTADVLAACNWPSVSMPQQAKAAGLKLKKVKDGKVTRYYAA